MLTDWLRRPREEAEWLALRRSEVVVSMTDDPGSMMERLPGRYRPQGNRAPAMWSHCITPPRCSNAMCGFFARLHCGFEDVKEQEA